MMNEVASCISEILFLNEQYAGRNKNPALFLDAGFFSFHGMPLWGLGGWVNPMPLVVPSVEESLTK
jgi:hypothetical protein